MKIQYEKHGVEGVENCLNYLANSDADYIDGDEFEIIGEDEEGREGSADISIINLAEEACKALAAQRKRIAELEEREAALAAHVEFAIVALEHRPSLDSGHVSNLVEVMRKADTSILARRDLMQRALELEALSLKMNKDWEGNDCIWPETLTDRYNELRQQAEQG